MGNDENSIMVLWVFIGWITLSCLIGWIFSLFTNPPDFIWIMYLEYSGFIYYYDLFCLAMMPSFALMPLALIFSWKGLWQSSKIIEKPSKSRIFVFAMLTPISLTPSFGFLFLSDDRGSLFHIFLNLLTFLFDWIGGVIFNISCLIVFLWLVTFTTKLIVEFKNGRKKYY